MNILRRGVQAAKAAIKNHVAAATESRRIEVTVERETLTMLVRGQPKDNKDTAKGKERSEFELLELSPPAPTSGKKKKKCS